MEEFFNISNLKACVWKEKIKGRYEAKHDREEKSREQRKEKLNVESKAGLKNSILG